MIVSRSVARVILAMLACLAVWECVGRGTAFGLAVLPAPSRIVLQFARDADLYRLHGIATFRTASIGFVFGSAAAIAAALVFCLAPVTERLLRGVNIALFAMPAIVVGPLLVLLFDGDLPQIILAALLVYFPTMSAALLGLRDIDPRLVSVVQAYGGGRWALLRLVRLRSALPNLFAGLRTAAPLAVLGAVFGEFGSGTRWGFGSFLLSALPQANPARLWGVGLATSTIALAGYCLFLLPANWLSGTTSAVTLAAARASSVTSAPRRAALVATLVSAAVLPFVLWWSALEVTQLSPIIAPGPLRTAEYLFTAPGSAEARAVLGAALRQTLPVAALGLLAGLGTAFLLAALAVLAPALARALMPVALIAQNMPLVAIVPLVALAMGREVGASVFMAVLVVFFPAFIILSQGFAMTPRPAQDLVSAYGGSRLTRLRLVVAPYATAHLFAAAKLVAPQAILGVMVAEWLLTGVGLGNLLNASRGTMDYEMIWAGAVVSILISVAAFEAVGLLERRFAHA